MKTNHRQGKKVQFISTRGHTDPCSFVQAMKLGLAPDGGLFMPDHIPVLPEDFWKALDQMEFRDISSTIAGLFFDSKREIEKVKRVVEKAINFDAPLIHLENNTYLLELFHGPTLAFKDFGARFMARAFASLDDEKENDLMILVATSGDTGSAVAHGFYGVEGIKVCLLYPSGKVSSLQEQQMTTLGKNITAFEVDGTFDDCQKLVKQAFSDHELRKQINISSANSINIARLIPQSFYYVYAVAQLRRLFKEDAAPVFSVPSGNFGNLTAGLLAAEMGMPASLFLAATNQNDIVPEFLKTGLFRPRSSIKTISNAMDVGNPSNFERIQYLFHGSTDEIRKHLWGISFDDKQTGECIKDTYKRTGYILDPHTAVGVLASQNYRTKTGTDEPIVILGTAHPAKFAEIVEQQIDREIDMPEQLKACMKKEKRSIKISHNYKELRNYMLGKFN